MTATSVAIVASEGFSTFHFSVPLILFGDSVSSEKRFTRYICAETPGMIWSREGTAVIADADFSTLAQCEIVIVPFWRNVDEKPSPALLDALVAARHNGATLVGLCLGTFALAYAGLLDQHRAVTHWEYENAFLRLFPTCSSTLTCFIPTTMVLSPPPAPPRRWTVVSMLFVSVLAQRSPTR